MIIDGKEYKWICEVCPYNSSSMYAAETHQCETDHAMKRILVK